MQVGGALGAACCVLRAACPCMAAGRSQANMIKSWPPAITPCKPYHTCSRPACPCYLTYINSAGRNNPVLPAACRKRDARSFPQVRCPKCCAAVASGPCPTILAIPFSLLPRASGHVPPGAPLSEAVARYQAAAALQPQYAPALYNLGVVAGELRQLDAAVQYYRAAIAAEPRYAQVGIVLDSCGKGAVMQRTPGACGRRCTGPGSFHTGMHLYHFGAWAGTLPAESVRLCRTSSSDRTRNSLVLHICIRLPRSLSPCPLPGALQPGRAAARARAAGGGGGGV